MFDKTEEMQIRAMLAEWQATKDAQAQSLVDQRDTAQGQLVALRPLLSDEAQVKVDASIPGPAREAVSLKE